MFTLLKIVKPLLLPPALLVFGMVSGVVMMSRNRRTWGRRVLVASVAVFFLLSIEPVSYFLARSLERTVEEPTQEALERADVIVVLAGGAHRAGGHRQRDELGGESWHRLIRGVQVFHQLNGTIPLLYSGGSGDPFDLESVEARLAAQYARDLGIPDDMVWIEDASRDTYESGVAVAQLLASRRPGEQMGVALVTSARHLPRGVGVFTKLGFAVVAVPADRAAGSFSWDALSILPSAAAFSSSNVSIHEWVGRIVYRLRDRL
jgi:uncharacterized SAM-binding protein YcdF (DUF218 family)